MSRLCIHTPIGWLRLRDENDAIIESVLVSAPEESESPSLLLLEAGRQLEAYFRGELYSFDLPLDSRGTEFERAVWKRLSAIPYGSTHTYSEIAQALGKPGAARAVGRACGKNPLLILVPCHRVMGKGGKLTGFSAGLRAKQMLLAIEGIKKTE